MSYLAETLTGYAISSARQVVESKHAESASLELG
jgi:hypothetical protein